LLVTLRLNERLAVDVYGDKVADTMIGCTPTSEMLLVFTVITPAESEM
jgi:hypothetical protein